MNIIHPHASLQPDQCKSSGMASLTTIPCVTIGRHRDIARNVASFLAPHGFSVNGILSIHTWSDSELALVLRVLEPRPQALLIGGGYTDEEAEKAQAVFDEYTKEMDISNGKLVRVASGVVEKVGPKGVAGWILEELQGHFRT